MKKQSNKTEKAQWPDDEIGKLSSKIEKKELELNPKLKKKSDLDLGLASRISTDLVGGILAGLIIGIYFDKLLESKPIFVIICLILGIAAGIKSIMKHLGN